MPHMAPVDETLTMGEVVLKTRRFTTQDPGAKIVCLDGPCAGATLDLQDEPVVIGSSATCDLVLSDPRVSRRHLRATYVGRAVDLVDLDSKNGSYHGGERFVRTQLPFGAEFHVGASLFKILPAERTLDPAQAETSCFGQLVGGSADMRKLFTMIEQVAATDVSVLIEGETGVGKELVAEEIHRRSDRRNKPFVVFDCGAIPSELIESALFGHVRGAFTGATCDRDGLFADADGGTVFLDEIGELRLDLQPSLLRVLDRGTVRRVGESQFRHVDVRIVAATHRSLAVMIEQDQFREDLYYRLAVVRLAVPPLRDRPEDVEELARHFLLRSGRPDLRLDEELLARLRDHAWPGNVRELRNLIERGVALARDGVLHVDQIGRAPAKRAAAVRVGPRLAFRDAKAAAVESFERAYLSDLMNEYDSLTAAASAADMDRKHLRVLLKRHGIG